MGKINLGCHLCVFYFLSCQYAEMGEHRRDLRSKPEGYAVIELRCGTETETVKTSPPSETE